VHQVLLGVTGSGKTFTMANVIAAARPPGADAGAQQDARGAALQRVQGALPDNAVEYFVSYYDYYQPEAYIPSSDTFIEKDAIDQRGDRPHAHSATRALSSRRDVIIVASRVVHLRHRRSPRTYVPRHGGAELDVGDEVRRDELLRRWWRCSTSATTSTSTAARSACAATWSRSSRPTRRTWRLRIEWFGDEIERLAEIDPLRGKVLRELKTVAIFPARHYVTPAERAEARRPSKAIRESCASASGAARRASCSRPAPRAAHHVRPRDAGADGLLPRHRELLAAPEGRAPGEPPPTLLDYFPRTFCWWSTRATSDGAADRRHVPRRPRAQGDAGRATASACRARSTTGRCVRGVEERAARRST
jgi:excinuclease ABC subunit B